MALNARQKKYCRERANGAGYAEAFEKAGYAPTASTKTRKVNAFKMENTKPQAAEIQAEIKRLQDLADKKAILSREQKRAFLSETALDSEKDTPDRLRALDMLNRMDGDYTDKIQTQVAGKIDLDYRDKLAAIQQAIAESE